MLTQEQRMHREEYDRAKLIYERTYSYKINAQNEIVDIQNRRKYIIEEINNTQTERKRFEETSEYINRTVQSDNDINNGLLDAENKLETASEGFLGIGSSGTCKLKNLKSVFEESDRTARLNISTAFEKLKTTKTTIDLKIEELLQKINQLENELENGRNRERVLQNSMEEYSRTISNSLYTMAYHKKYLY